MNGEDVRIWKGRASGSVFVLCKKGVGGVGKESVMEEEGGA